MHTSLIFLAQLQTFPTPLKKLQFTVLFSSRMMETIQPSPQPVKYFQHFPHTEKRMERYSLIEKKSCLWLLFSIFLFCPLKIKLFLKSAHVSNVSPLLQRFATPQLPWEPTEAVRQTTLNRTTYLKSIFYSVWHKKSQPEAFYYATTSNLYTSHLLMQSTSVTVKWWSMQEIKEIVTCLAKTMLITKEKLAYFKIGGHLQVSPLQQW